MSSMLNTRIDIQIDTQIDKQIDKQIDRQIHIIKRKLNFFNLTIENIFTHLYSNKSISFWFDSTASHTYDYNNQTVSILGSLDHSLSKSIECVDFNQVVIRNETSCYNLSINIFEYIQQLIDREKVTNIDYTYDVIDQSNNLNNERTNDLSIDLPINLTTVLFGYLSYELRHLTTNVLDNNINRYNSKYNLTSRSIDSHTTNYSIDYPLALYLQPVRYIVYDHLTDDLFIISTQDSTMNNYAESTKSLADYLLDQIVELSYSKRNIYSTVDTSKSPSNNLNNNLIDKPITNLPNNIPVLLADKTRTAYSNNINKCIEYIKQGETYEVCLTLQFKGSLKQSISSYNHYLSLRSGNRAPYSCYIRYDNKCNSDFAVLCSSPERFIKISQDGLIETKPIKGTAKRNLTNALLDQQIAYDLKNDVKSKSENLMIVDLLRNDLSRVCQINSINVTKLMDIETYSTVHQLVTTINGKLNKYNNIMDVLISTFPGGSMTGAPKIRTLDIIDKLENRPRGIYSGTIGYIGLNGIMDKNIVIRTAVISNDVITIGSGGAIVILSDPAKEVDEVITKAEAVSRSLGYRLQFPEEL